MNPTDQKISRPRITSYDGLNHPVCHFWSGYITVFFWLHIQFPMLIGDLCNIKYHGGLFVGWVLIDAMIYFIHMFIDSKFYDQYFAKNEKQEYAIIDQHHTFTMNYSLLTANELIYMTYPVFIPIVTCFHICEVLYGVDGLSAFYRGARLTFSMLGLLGGYTHKWAHERTCHRIHNKFICWLQDAGVILNPRHHRPHHTTHTSHYALINGFTQPLLDIFFAKENNNVKQD